MTGPAGLEDHPAVRLARDLIRCASVTPAEAGALSVLADVLRPAGFAVERRVFSEAGTDDVENLFAKIGSGSPHLAFLGHTDVVPPGPADAWRRPPFGGALEAGELYGRGAVDMKGGIAAFVAAALGYLERHGGVVPGTLSLLITGDEEGPSVNGTAKLIDWCVRRGERFDAALIGEPTSAAALGDTVKIGRRGTLSGEVAVTGVQGHSAYPEKARNPIPALVDIAGALIAPPLDRGNPRFQPSNLEVVSVDVGNPAWNVIPGRASLRFNVRFNDEWTVPTLTAEIERRATTAGSRHAGVGVAVTVLRPGEAFLTRPGPLTDMVVAAIAEVTGRTPELSTGGGTSDARFIKDYCPVIEFGLVGTTMHQIDERVPVAELADLAAIYGRFLDRFFGAGR